MKLHKVQKISESQVIRLVSRRHSIPWVCLDLIEISSDVLALVPPDVARDFALIPIYVRTDPRGDKTLYVAVRDPGDTAALRFVSASAGMPVRPMIARLAEITRAVSHYYYGDEPAPLGRPDLDRAFRKPTLKKTPSPKRSSPPPVPRAALQRKAAPSQTPRDEWDEAELNIHVTFEDAAQAPGAPSTPAAALRPRVRKDRRAGPSRRRRHRKATRTRCLVEAHRRSGPPPRPLAV